MRCMTSLYISYVINSVCFTSCYQLMYLIRKLLRFVLSDKRKVVPAHVMKVYRRSASMVPLILNLGIS